MPDQESRPDIVLEAPLGVGRTSRVWRGRLRSPWSDFETGTAFAVKILRPELVREPDALATLRAEAEVSRVVHHSALARTRFADLSGPTPPLAEHAEDDLAPDVTADAGAPRPWLLLDLVPGGALDEAAAREGSLPEPQVRQLGARIARALAAMHAAGWVHGDVKPANVRIDREGRAVLVDLGFARRAGSPSAPLGTPAYLAPERARGGAPTAAADAYALGALIYELLVGARVIGDVAPHDETALEQARSGRIPPPSDTVPRVSPLLDAIVLTLLSASPNARPTASDVAQVLEEGESSAWWRERIAFDASARRDTVAWSGQHGIPLVGRDAELRTLESTWAEARVSGKAVLLSGEQGAGKSRLLAEFAHRVRHGEGAAPLYLYGRCDTIGDERPGAPLIGLLRRWLHLPRGARPGQRARALVEDLVPPDVARTLLRLLDPDETGSAPAEVAESVALGDWLVALARTTPTIVFLDDSNFAGKATLDALRRLARVLESTHILLVVGLRRRAEVRHVSALTELRARLSGRTVRIDLGPLDEAAVLQLVEHAFHHAVPRLRLARTLFERTAGMPGSIGELLRLANQKGWTRKAAPPARGLQLLVAPEDLPRPASIGVAVAQRLEALGGRERVWLERLAVLGSRIEPKLFAASWPRADAAARDEAIASLVRSSWLVSAGGRYRFAHPIEREETLQRTPPRRLARAHSAVARALGESEDQGGLRPSFRRAYHLREAGDALGLLAILPALLRGLHQAGHPQRRATLARWGLESLDDATRTSTDEMRTLERELLEELADAADRLGERDEQRRALERLSDLDLDLVREPGVGARVYLLHARHATVQGQLGMARGFLRNAQQLGNRAAEQQRSVSNADAKLALDRPEIERWFARIEIETGDYAAAKSHAELAVQLAPEPVSQAKGQLLHAEVEIHEGKVDEALRRLAAARRSLRAADGGLRARATRAAASLVSGRAWRLVGRPYRAAHALERAAELSIQAGEGRIEVEVAARRGRLLADVKREHEAEATLRDALFSARRIEDLRGETLAALFLGTLLAEEGVSGAPDLVRRARVLAEDLGMRRIEALALAIEARLAREASDVEGALAKSDEAARLLDRHGAELPDRIVIGATRALVLEEQDRAAEGEKIVRALRRRIESDNARLQSPILRQRHRRWTVALLASASSAAGPLYPRVVLAE